MRMYSITFNRVAVTAAQDFFEVLIPSDAIGRLHRMTITQDSESKDNEDEMLHVSIRRVTGSPTSGSGGSTPTPQALSFGDPAAGFTAEANNTTQLTGGTNVILHAEAFNVRAGLDYFPPPELRPDFSPSQRLLVTLAFAPGDSVTMTGVLYLEEIGG